MKNTNTTSIKKYSIMVIFMLTIFIGCSKDKITFSPLGEGTGEVNSTGFTTNYAYAWGLGPYSNSSAENFVFELSNGSNNGHYYSSETTNVIGFDILSATDDKIAPGIYTLSTSDVHAEFTFQDAYAHINLVNQDGDLIEGDRFENAEGGTIVVSYPNGVFKLEYEINLENGVTLSGSYQGKTRYFKI